MELQRQVCSLDQAVKLKELGIPQLGICLYYESSVGTVLLHKLDVPTFDKEYSAFTVAELGCMLVISDDTHFIDMGFNEHGGTWDVNLMKRDQRQSSGFRLINQEEGETEAESRAEMLIYLLEQKIVKPENCDLSKMYPEL